MTPSTAAQLAFTQVWQLTALIVIVALAVRLIGRRRPHLAHVLWLVVLAKCLTPPLIVSPGGVFCRWQPRFDWLDSTGSLLFGVLLEPQREEADRRVALNHRQSARWLKLQGGDADSSTFGADAHNVDQHAGFEEPIAAGAEAISEDDLIAAEFAGERSGLERHLCEPGSSAFERVGDPFYFQMGASVWLVGSLLLVILAGVRLALCLRYIGRHAIERHPELDSLLVSMQRRLGVRRRVRLVVTGSRVGPAVVGLWRPTIVLPTAIVRVQSIRTLEAILAHELIHVRRGDLWTSLIQVLAQGVWWFHPLVWLANRRGSQAAEACCDEEVIAELGCNPAAYAHSLLEILELKRGLIPVPAFPGMKPVDVTRERLERIMQLGQGCRKRTPWWCWAVLIAVAAATLPGAALISSAQENSVPAVNGEAESRGGPSANDARPPESGDEKAVAPLELVFFQDQFRRKLPAVMISAGEETVVVTTGPATIVPDGTPHAIDRAFLQVDGIPRFRAQNDTVINKQGVITWHAEMTSGIRAQYDPDSTAELMVYRAPGKWTDFRPKDPVRLAVGDSLSAIYERGPKGWRVTPTAAKVVALDRATDLQRADHDFHHKFTELIEIDRALPEGAPLFKEGRLAGITLLGARFLGADAKRSYVVPVNRITELCTELEKTPSKDRAAPKNNAPPERDRANNSVSKKRSATAEAEATAVLWVETASGQKLRVTRNPVPGSTDKGAHYSVTSDSLFIETRPERSNEDLEHPFVITADRVETTRQNERKTELPADEATQAEPGPPSADRTAMREDAAEPLRRSFSSVVTVTRINSKNGEPGQNRRSGIVFDERGYVVTTWSGEDQSRDRFIVRLADKSEYLAKPVASDPRLNLAILRLRIQPDRPIAAVSLTNAPVPRQGDAIVAVPSPAQEKAQTGVVTGVGQNLGGEFPTNLIQSDLPLILGEGGSLMVSAKGEPLGIWVAMRHGKVRASYAVPIADALPFLKKALPQADADNDLILMVYPVADLIIPVAHAYVDVAFPEDAKEAGKKPETPVSAKADFGPILELIQSTVAPESWDSAGGPGSIRPFDKTLSLVVRQSRNVHEEIADLLSQFRRVRDLRALLDLEIIRLREGEFAKGLMPKEQPADPGLRTTTLTDEQLQAFGKKLAGSDQVLSRDALKMVLENGQGVELALRRLLREGDKQPPVVQLLPVISADRKKIRLRFATGAASALDALARSRTADADDGQALLVDLTDELQSGRLVGIPIQPGTRLFKAVPAERVLLLLTPKVIVAEEEEEAINTDVPAPVAAPSPPPGSQP